MKTPIWIACIYCMQSKETFMRTDEMSKRVETHDGKTHVAAQ